MRAETSGTAALRIFATWAVVLVMAIASLAALGLALRLFFSEPSLYRALMADHVRAMIGIPIAAAGAFCVLLVFEARAGQLEFEALGFRFRGGAGPAVIWVFAFLAIAGAIRLLW